MSIIFNSAGIAETMNNGVSNVTGADSIITENYTNVVQHGIKIDVAVREKTISGTPPLTFNSNGTPLLGFLISGNMVQSGTPTPDNPIQPSECGDLETSGTKAGQYKIPISSANTTTPIYLGEVETTRRIKKFVLNGTESEDVLKMPSPNLFYYKVQNGLPLNYGACRCTHYINNQVPNAQLNNDEVKIDVTNVWGSTANVIVFKDTSKATLEDFKTWLQQQYTSGTPVTVWYVLATPQTDVVNEPLMKIGDYADTVSMEQSGVTIPTASGNNTLDVQTTPKPSNVSITYKGR